MAKSAAAAEAKSETPAKVREVRALSENRLKLVLSSAADVGNGFAAVTPIGTPFEDVLQPEFWAHTAYKLRPGDEITVHTDDMGYYGRIYVRDVSAPALGKRANRATVSLLEQHDFDSIAKEQRTKNAEVKFLGPHQKWCVVSLTDQRVLKEGAGTRDEALQQLRTLEA